MHSNGPPLAPVPQAHVAAAGIPTVQPGMMCCACMNMRAWGARCAVRVLGAALVGGGAADCKSGFGPPAGGWPLAGGPFCPIASEVPPTSSAIMARLFMVVIFTSECLCRAHPDVQEETPLGDCPFQ